MIRALLWLLIPALIPAPPVPRRPAVDFWVMRAQATIPTVTLPGVHLVFSFCENPGARRACVNIGVPICNVTWERRAKSFIGCEWTLPRTAPAGYVARDVTLYSDALPLGTLHVGELTVLPGDAVAVTYRRDWSGVAHGDELSGWVYYLNHDRDAAALWFWSPSKDLKHGDVLRWAVTY